MFFATLRAAGASLLAIGLAVSAFAAEAPALHDAFQPGDIRLAEGGKALPILIDAADPQVVKIVAGDFSEDVERVAGVRPQVVEVKGGAPASGAASKEAIIAGTLDSPLVQAAVKGSGADLSELKGLWESFKIMAVDHPLPGIDRALLVAGSDRRGTAYGLFTLSQAIGVSPWVWWADVAPAKHAAIYLAGDPVRQGPPTVQYRGIFLNDEDWGLNPWATQTYEPESADAIPAPPNDAAAKFESGRHTKNIGPKTYSKIFELLLRLKGNCLWPAMHEITAAFNLDPRNKVAADQYAIVMGSSHAEPMLSDNVSEWARRGEGEWNFLTNPAGVSKYWQERVDENGKYENLWTVGMRGIHDSGMPGGKTVQDKARILEAVFDAQRKMLTAAIPLPIDKIPQIFCPYKEVLDIYRSGLKVPDDVTIMWADDNLGYVRQLPNDAEQKREGRGGVYYHLSYFGRPHDFLWLYSTPLSQVWEEVSKSIEYTADRVWIANVGDIKPAEIGMSFYFDLIWDAKKFDATSQKPWLVDWAGKTFGTKNAAEIADIMWEYYRLNGQRKPEHMGFNGDGRMGGSPVRDTEFSHTNYGNEAQQRIDAFAKLMARAEAAGKSIPAQLQDAYFELVLYPVSGAALMNEKVLFAEASRLDAAQNYSVANDEAAKAQAAYDKIQALTEHYNKQVAGGKWNLMMSSHPRNLPVFAMPAVGHVDPAKGVAKPEAEKQAARGDALPKIRNFVEKDGVIAIDAEHFAVEQRYTQDRGWRVIEGWGRSGAAVGLFPRQAPSLRTPEALLGHAAWLDYFIERTSDPSTATLRVEALPTHEINDDHALIVGVSIDEQPVRILEFEQGNDENNRVWQANVVRSAMFATAKVRLEKGQHLLKLWGADPSVIVDRIVIDLGGEKPSYLGPPETATAPESDLLKTVYDPTNGTKSSGVVTHVID